MERPASFEVSTGPGLGRIDDGCSSSWVESDFEITLLILRERAGHMRRVSRDQACDDQQPSARSVVTLSEFGQLGVVWECQYGSMGRRKI